MKTPRRMGENGGQVERLLQSRQLLPEARGRPEILEVHRVAGGFA